jgi:2-polyprenyl-3-methyl-5-hydroxy-6-metoxy-1,4-benzoquinol methylase
MDMKTTKSQLISKCLITGKDTTKILDLGMHPYADTFISKDQLHLSEPVFPLQVNMNPESGQIQLGYISNDNDRYNLYSYSYTSSNSKFARNHWDKYFENIKSKYNINGVNVLEIGSNDGYLTEKFINKDNYVLGIDSSKTMCDIASSKGIDTISELFSSDLSNTLTFEFDIIIANNVFNHANDPVDFAKGVENILSKDGIFVFELPYWGSTIQSEKI